MKKNILFLLLFSTVYTTNIIISAEGKSVLSHHQQSLSLNFMPGIALPPQTSNWTFSHNLQTKLMPLEKQGVATQANNRAQSQITAWKKEVANWRPEDKYQEKMTRMIKELKTLALSDDEKKNFIIFLKEQHARLKNQEPVSTKPKTPIIETDAMKSVTKSTTSSSSSEPSIQNIKQSFFNTLIEHGMGLFGFGRLAQAKKTAEKIAAEEEKPQQLFDLIQGFTPKEQEDILNAWVIGWRANLIKNNQSPKQLQEFKKQLELMIIHMKKILPKQYAILLTTHDYTTNSLSHHTVKVSILDAKKATTENATKVYSEGNLHIYHKDTPWSDYIFSEALNYIKEEIAAALRGEVTHHSA